MFNWLSSKPKSNLPEVTPLESQRCKQIEQLKTVHYGVSEIKRDLEYRVNAYVHGNTFYIYITLPPRFPADKPQIKVSPDIKHPWVDDMMIVTGSPTINNFSVHSNLAQAIKEIVDEFERNPPTISQQTYNANRYAPYPANANIRNNQPSYPGYPAYTATSNTGYTSQVQTPTLPPSYSSSSYCPPVNTGSTTTLSNTQASVPTLPPSHISNTYQTPVITGSSSALSTEMPAGLYKMPDINGRFTQIQELSVAELEAVLNNEDKLNDLISKSSQILQLNKDMESMTQNNELLARENLKNKPILEDRKRTILEKYDQLNELHNQFGVNSKKQEELLRGYKSHILQDRLKIAASQAEEEAEAIAEQFLDGEISLDEFKTKYMGIRTLSHLRKAKEEKLHSDLLQYRNS